MPRFIRSAWGTIVVNGAKKHATGPKSRNGQYCFALAMRERGEIADDVVEVDAIGAADGKSTLLRVTVRGTVVHEERIEQ